MSCKLIVLVNSMLLFAQCALGEKSFVEFIQNALGILAACEDQTI